MRFFKKNRKSETTVKTEEYIETPPVNEPPMPKTPGRPKKEPCHLCKLLASQGRTGEISGTFLDGDPYTFEIMNQKGVDGRECYTLFVQNDSTIGFNEMSINNCPLCGRRLGARIRE